MAYAYHVIMQTMGWSWHDLMTTPADVISDEWAFINTERKFYAEKAKKGSDE